MNTNEVNRAGEIELTDAELEAVYGAGISLGAGEQECEPELCATSFSGTAVFTLSAAGAITERTFEAAE